MGPCSLCHTRPNWCVGFGKHDSILMENSDSCTGRQQQAVKKVCTEVGVASLVQVPNKTRGVTPARVDESI